MKSWFSSLTLVYWDLRYVHTLLPHWDGSPREKFRTSILRTSGHDHVLHISRSRRWQTTVVVLHCILLKGPYFSAAAHWHRGIKANTSSSHAGLSIGGVSHLWILGGGASLAWPSVLATPGSGYGWQRQTCQHWEVVRQWWAAGMGRAS